MPEIREWRDIDADWLTAALKDGGIDARVASFEAGKVGTGQIGDCVRASVTDMGMISVVADFRQNLPAALAFFMF